MSYYYHYNIIAVVIISADNTKDIVLSTVKRHIAPGSSRAGLRSFPTRTRWPQTFRTTLSYLLYNVQNHSYRHDTAINCPVIISVHKLPGEFAHNNNIIVVQYNRRCIVYIVRLSSARLNGRTTYTNGENKKVIRSPRPKMPIKHWPLQRSRYTTLQQ